MRNYIAVIFNDRAKAYESLHALWQFDSVGEITVHGTAVVHRDALGQIRVDTKETHPGLATAVGVGVGALLGLFAGPAGVAIGAATGASLAAAGAGLGAAAGAVVGGITDLARADTRDNALRDTSFVLGTGQSAVIADVTEDWVGTIDDRMRQLSGTVYRRSKSDVREDSSWAAYDSYFYPYEYVPRESYYW